ncbi:MAG: peroxide stress protein YaaA [Proteobacteria bacterium]|jgi:uncharacterized protein|nr:peroxide stress protein YaaA [Pseudomonadota bacterium]
MLTVLSPAKTLDYETHISISQSTLPEFVGRSSELVKIMRGNSPQQIASLMGVSDKIAHLNYGRFADWDETFPDGNSRQSALAFKGDVYTGLEAYNFNTADFEFAQQHLRILSGLYGVLRPLDLMQPYRLEMGTQLATDRGENLYQFWGDLIVESLNRQLQSIDSNTLVNLASNEYFKSVDTSKLDANIVTPVFKNYKNGKYKIISFYAKKTRGLMAAWLIKNRITDPAQLNQFNQAGYSFSAQNSANEQLVFLRDEIA